MAVSKYRAQLMAIAQEIVDNSAGRARLAFQEDDASKEVVADAAHFIKVDEKRVGRDIELYGFFEDTVMGWGETLTSFLEEVLLPIKSLKLDASYQAASITLRDLGHEVFEPGLHKNWDAIF